MTVGIVGLGLIGGSMAKAFKRSAEVTVLAENRNKTMLDFAMLSGAVDAPLTMENIGNCDLVLLCTYPEAAEEYLKNAAEHIPPVPENPILMFSSTIRIPSTACSLLLMKWAMLSTAITAPNISRSTPPVM